MASKIRPGFYRNTLNKRVYYVTGLALDPNGHEIVLHSDSLGVMLSMALMKFEDWVSPAGASMVPPDEGHEDRARRDGWRPRFERLNDADLAPTRTLNDLQVRAQWGSHEYTDHFNADPRRHHHASHALQHITKASGIVAGVLDDLDHGDAPNLDDARKGIADIVICTLRLANELFAQPIDVTDCVVNRMDEKKMGKVRP